MVRYAGVQEPTLQSRRHGVAQDCWALWGTWRPSPGEGPAELPILFTVLPKDSHLSYLHLSLQ